MTDPYAHSLSTNSEYSQVVDLNDSALKPEGWDGLTMPHAQKTKSRPGENDDPRIAYSRSLRLGSNPFLRSCAVSIWRSPPRKANMVQHLKQLSARA
ncbi:pullulanase [Klebsiella pneumoniae subsp. ozaenae]|uniref:Pullulanase n=1 Tax=Klebsiella pneumoniae subsp. ozaenae TaxID=574 RepID=A0A377Z0W9_KLEPO|nr:pullulanase [Klebsiella pneumoniae subsp. ozaenae]